MSAASALGTVYRCPICGAEVTVVVGRIGHFTPVCCNVAMLPKRDRAPVYYCPRCGAQIAVLHRTQGQFEPVCCAIPMVRRAA